jgi:hypothetical protein
MSQQNSNPWISHERENGLRAKLDMLLRLCGLSMQSTPKVRIATTALLHNRERMPFHNTSQVQRVLG